MRFRHEFYFNFSDYIQNPLICRTLLPSINNNKKTNFATYNILRRVVETNRMPEKLLTLLPKAKVSPSKTLEVTASFTGIHSDLDLSHTECCPW